MMVTVPPGLQKRIEDKVSSGAYRSADEVLAEGMRLLELRDKRLADLRADIQLGINELDRGEGLGSADAFDGLRRKYG